MLFAGEIILSSAFGPGYVTICTYEDGTPFDDERWVALGKTGGADLQEELLKAYRFLRGHNLVR